MVESEATSGMCVVGGYLDISGSHAADWPAGKCFFIWGQGHWEAGAGRSRGLAPFGCRPVLLISAGATDQVPRASQLPAITNSMVWKADTHFTVLKVAFDVNFFKRLVLMVQVVLVLVSILQPSWTCGTLSGRPCTWDQRQGWGLAGDKNDLVDGMGREQRPCWVDNRGSGPYQMSLDMWPEERSPFDGVLEGKELQAGITETAEVSPPKKACLTLALWLMCGLYGPWPMAQGLGWQS